jgi:hypothetical protein
MGKPMGTQLRGHPQESTRFRERIAEHLARWMVTIETPIRKEDGLLLLARAPMGQKITAGMMRIGVLYSSLKNLHRPISRGLGQGQNLSSNLGSMGRLAMGRQGLTGLWQSGWGVLRLARGPRKFHSTFHRIYKDIIR